MIAFSLVSGRLVDERDNANISKPVKQNLALVGNMELALKPWSTAAATTPWRSEWLEYDCGSSMPA